MAWYRCSCGFLTEQFPQHGDVVVSVHHLHPAARADGGAAVVRMVPLPDPIPARGERTPKTALTLSNRKVHEASCGSVPSS